MPLTPEQIAEMDKITGLGPTPDPHTDTSEIDAAIAAAPKPKPGIVDRVKKDFNTRVNTAADAQNKDQGVTSKIVQTVGQGAGFVGDLGAEAVKGAAGVVGGFASKVAPETSKKVSEFTKSKVKAVAESQPVQDTAKAYSDWKAAHPEAAANLEGIGNIASLLPIGKGAGMAGEAVGKVAGKAENMAINMGKKGIEKNAKKNIDAAFEITAPKVTKMAEETAFKEGRVTREGVGPLKKAKITPSTQDQRVAEAIQPLVENKSVKVGAPPEKNIEAIGREVTKTNQGVRAMIADRKIPFNEAQLRAKLNAAKEESRVIFGNDKTLEGNYDAIVNELVKQVGKKDTLGLFDARQSFDNVIRQKFPKLFENEATDNVRANAVRDVRRAANEYIADQLPENNPYRDALRRESHMIRAIENIAEKSTGQVGKSALEIFIKNHPQIKEVLKYGLGGLGVYGASKAIFP